jgi:hypothetical protein
LTEIADARRRWYAATEPSRQQGLAADAELRRRYPNMELPPLHPPAELPHTEDELDRSQAEGDPGSFGRPGAARLDLETALAAARRAEEILAEREHQAAHDTGRGDDDLMRRREAQAEEEAAARCGAVRQDPAPSRHAWSLDLDELELEAGH